MPTAPTQRGGPKAGGEILQHELKEKKGFIPYLFYVVLKFISLL